MRIKILLTALLILIMGNLFAQEGIFTTINISATNVAFGWDSGAANIWNRNPLDVWSNPAKLGYYKGVSWGWAKDPWLEKVLYDMYMNSSYLAVGWKGVGILLPYINASGKFGTTGDLGEQETTDADGNSLGKFNSYETCSEFAIGINALETINNLTDTPLVNYADISIGYNYNNIISVLPPYSNGQTESNGRGKSHVHGLGIIARLSPLNKSNFKMLRMDFTYGMNLSNFTKTKINYGDSQQKDLYYGILNGYSMKLALDTKDVLSSASNSDPKMIEFITSFSKNIFSIYASYNTSKYMDESSSYGKGIEFTFFDIFSYRRGYYSDKAGDIEGKSKGYGINLGYKDWGALQYNYVEFPGGELQDKQTNWDVMLNLNLFKLPEIF